MPGHHKPLAISTQDIHEYVNRQSQLCDSRIEDAYKRLSKRYGQSKPTSPIPLDGLQRRTLSSSSISSSSRKHVTLSNTARPSSAQEHRSDSSKFVRIPKGILKKTESPTLKSAHNYRHSRESPDEWFQRIMQIKELSPLDLCDVFSYGDARKHPLVPLSHVCELIFDLDPEAANGIDPVTEEMEDFLYQFATEDAGNIMVNIKDALRALDIWQSRSTSSSAQVVPLKLGSDHQVKATILESKNRKLKDVISSLQDANLRLSKQLDSAKSALSPKGLDEATPPAWSPRSRATMKPSSIEVSPVKYKSTCHTKTSPVKKASSNTRLQVINTHEQELVEIASQLQFTGVKRLEELLIDGDADSTGFVNLKQLSWVLADQFDFRISETRLIEVCLGMNFDAHAQLDYREFVDVLLDILIYELPDIRESAKRKSLIRLDQYLQSGFPPGQEGTRQLLDALCSKYALKGDQCITVAELVRVLHVDLIKYHALALPFPLGEHETIQLARPFIQHGVNEKSGDGILSYTELLDALLGPFPFDFRPEGTGNEKPKRVLQWEFWHSIYMSLCGGDSMITQKVLAQLEKILAKVDPTTTFMMSTRHFRRIFERHISSDDMDVLLVALRVQDDTESTLNSGSEPPVRYDVLMKLVFGVPELNDSTFFENCVRKKLLREQDRLRAYTTDLVTVQGASHTLTLEDFYDTFVVQADLYPLAMVEMLFWFASLDFDHKGSVQLKSLIDVLKHKCWRAIKYFTVANVTFREHEVANRSCNTESIRKLIAKCCSSYNLYDVLVNISHKTQGQITTSVMHEELNKMLHELGVVGVHQDDLKCLLQIVARKSKGECPSVNTRDLIHYDAFFDELFDWKTLVSSMRLPHSLVDVKKVLEKFDWEHVGTIHCVDWSKAYRLICGGTAAMAEWEVRVLYQRFPGQKHHSEQSNKIDYARLLVFLLDYQLRQARESLQRLVIEHFRQKFGSADKPVSTSEMEQVFRSLDTDNKGYFNTIDLKNYLLKEFESQSTQESDDLIPLLHSSDALSSVMNLLVGIKTNEPDYHSANSSSPAVVRFDHFRNIGSFLTTPKNASSVLAQMIYPLQPRGCLSGENAHGEAASHIISSLRVLEITILDISSEFADIKGNILPTRAFRYLSFGPSAPPTRQSPQRSPLRRSALGSPTNPRVVLAGTIRTKKRELEASLLDPLTPARLKQILQIYRNIKVSTHLISQFFLHIGSSSKYFLDLLHYAQWAAPLSIEIQGKVRNVVRQMVVKGKGGGGRLDLDRFLAQLKRRLQDAPDYISTSGSSENSPPQSVSMALLLSKLHQLNIPLHKQELMALLRHFGMEDDLEAVDYGLFIQRLYELNSVGTLP